jgi:hypothetical protein
VVTAPALEYIFTRNCTGNASEGNRACAVELGTCPDGSPQQWVYTSPAGSDAPRRQDTPVCLAPSDVVDVDAALAASRQVLEERLPQPAFTFQPAGGAIVQLPVIVAAVQHSDAGFDVTVPVPGRLAATASYAWRFGDEATGSGPGRLYDGTSPTRHPGHYVAHTYRRPGGSTVTLTVTWNATFTLADGTQFPLEPLQFTTSRALRVHPTRSELISVD